MLLSNQEEIKKPCNKWKWKHNVPKSVKCSTSSFKIEVYNDTGWPQKTRKNSNKQTKLIYKVMRKNEPTKPKVTRKKK